MRPSSRTSPLIALVVAACGLTDLPDLKTEWTASVPQAAISAGAVLPAGAVLKADGSSILVGVTPRVRSFTLPGLCPACAGLNGQTVLKPAFDATISVWAGLPAGIRGGTLSRGNVDYRLDNALGFDPLRPGLSETGTGWFRASLSGPSALTDTIDGADRALPNGSNLTGSVPIAAGASFTDSVGVELRLMSPLGLPTRINTAGSLRLRATPTQLEFSALTVEVDTDPIPIDPRPLPVADLDDGFADRVVEAALVVTLSNPYSADFTFEGGVRDDRLETIGGSVRVEAGSSNALVVDLTGDQARALLGASAVLVGAITLDAPVLVTVGTGPILALDAAWRFRLVGG